VSAKQKLLDAENRGWSELHSRFDKLSDEDWLKPGVVDDWTPKDMIAHVAVWHAQTADRLESLRMTGERIFNERQPLYRPRAAAGVSSTFRV